jgi:hypothetical protein
VLRPSGAGYTEDVQDHGIDIVVMSPTGHRALVVEVKTRGSIHDATEQVSQYMTATGADVGMVFVADILRILRQTYRASPEVEVVGEYPISLTHGIDRPSDPLKFEDQVQQWLEALRDHHRPATEPLLSALEAHVMPSIADGDVRAARPRLQRAVG